jgi:hypothetical protein
MTPDTTVVATEELLTRMVGDELVLLDLARGVYYGLNPTGARIWELLAGGRSVHETAMTLAEEHDVAAAEAEREVVRLVEELRERGLVAARGR